MFISFDIGINNLAYAIVSRDMEIIEWEVMKIGESKQSMNKLCEQLLTLLNEKFAKRMLTDHVVLIENQPVNKNPTMKSVQMIVFTFFNLLKLNNSIENMQVCFVSASNKLKCIHKPEGIDSITASTKYAANKKKSILICEHYLERFIKTTSAMDWNKFFKSHKKRDDLADSFLQAVYVLEQGRL